MHTKADVIANAIALDVHRWMMEQEGISNWGEAGKPINNYAYGLDRVSDIADVIRQSLTKITALMKSKMTDTELQSVKRLIAELESEIVELSKPDHPYGADIAAHSIEQRQQQIATLQAEVASNGSRMM